MKLSRIYSNHPELFGPIEFRTGLNVILAEIRLPENRDKDTHNLGKTTIGRLVDFCFLARRDANFFLFKHEPLFGEFVFFLEILLDDSSCVTVRRGVKDATSICLKKHKSTGQDYANLPMDKWDHIDLPFERGRELLDGLLDWRAVAPWQFRKGLGYQLRSQDDYHDVFRLKRFAGKHADWKPYLAHILGFDYRPMDLHYRVQAQYEKERAIADTVRSELGGSVDDIGKIEGLLQLKQRDSEKKQKLLDAFDFRLQDNEQTKQLVEEIDTRIGELNSRRYSLKQIKKKIVSTLEEDEILFDPDDAQRLFLEVDVLFSGQIKKDFEQLIAFNRAITEERRGYLQEERAEVDAELKQVNSELNVLGKRRSDILTFLSGTDFFTRYRQVSDELVSLRADVETLKRRRAFIRRLQDLRARVRALSEESTHLQTQIEVNVEEQSANEVSMFSTIRLFFSEIVEDVIAHKALLNVYVNRDGHLEFGAGILDEAGNATSADLGHTYRKLLCIAFDLAVVRAHLGDKFPRFVYHDGVFESLDVRKKGNLLRVIREYAEYGVQSIITLIDSDMPPALDPGEPVFGRDEIVLTLHDEGVDGRLFRMEAW